MKRTALCTVKVCPHPTDPWFHVCERCGSPAVHHHHRIPKGMGGSKERDVKENIVMLCARHHEEAHGIGASTAEGEAREEFRDGADLASLSAAGASSSGGEGWPQRTNPPHVAAISPSPQAGGRDSRELPSRVPACAVTPAPSLESLE